MINQKLIPQTVEGRAVAQSILSQYKNKCGKPFSPRNGESLKWFRAYCRATGARYIGGDTLKRFELLAQTLDAAITKLKKAKKFSPFVKEFSRL